MMFQLVCDQSGVVYYNKGSSSGSNKLGDKWTICYKVCSLTSWHLRRFGMLVNHEIYVLSGHENDVNYVQFSRYDFDGFRRDYGKGKKNHVMPANAASNKMRLCIPPVGSSSVVVESSNFSPSK